LNGQTEQNDPEYETGQPKLFQPNREPSTTMKQKWDKKGTNDVLIPRPHNQSHKFGSRDQ
jgi:hypothetical protein